jgi:NAD(P)-dependent dehydrogenase (short-subunit alcohol dehydrogenase family)
MKTLVVTGDGPGLGRVTAGKLAHAGHRVVLVARTQAAAEAAAAEIRARNPDASVDPRAADLASLASIRAFAAALVDDAGGIDVLFNIASVLQTSPSRRVTADGLEETLAVNALAPFLLTRLLLPALERPETARVVNVSSRLHLPGSRGKPVGFDFGDPQLEHGYNPTAPTRTPSSPFFGSPTNSSAGCRRASPPPTPCVLGSSPPTAAASTSGAMHWLMANVLPHMPFATSIDAATDSFVFMALDPSLDAVGGKFFGDKHQIESSPESYDLGKAKRFWELASQLTGLNPD